MPSYTLIGTAFAITGNLLISFGLNLQKTSRYLRSWKWWLGFTLMTSGEIENFIAYGFIPVVMVSSLGIITLISNVIIAPLIFDQRLRARDIFGTVLASIGVVLVILSLNGAKHVTDPMKLFDRVIFSINFIVYFAVSAAAVCALMLQQEKSVIQNLAIVAIFGSYTVISTKLLSVLVEYSIISIFASYKPWVLLLVIVITSYLQIKYLNKALKLNSSTVVIPLHYIFFNLTVIASSIIVFQDFASATLAQLSLFILGVALTFLSVTSICSDDSSRAVADVEESGSSDDCAEVALIDSNGSARPFPGIMERAKSTSHLLIDPINQIHFKRGRSSSEGDYVSYGTMIVGSGIIVNTFINYANTTTGVSNVDVDTNSHD